LKASGHLVKNHVIIVSQDKNCFLAYRSSSANSPPGRTTDRFTIHERNKGKVTQNRVAANFQQNQIGSQKEAHNTASKNWKRNRCSTRTVGHQFATPKTYETTSILT
jgi:hypothetical protein